jgi:HK97 family phage major capsid protein
MLSEPAGAKSQRLEVELRPEPLRYAFCATGDLLEDSAINLEQHMLNKVARAYRGVISDSIINGDGLGKPAGLLHPYSGIIVCDTSPSAPAVQFSWQDVLLLRFQVAPKWQPGASYPCNQNTIGLLLSMSDAVGRPVAPLTGQPWPAAGTSGFTIFGAPLHVVTQLPDPVPGACCIGFGNWREAYALVVRRGVTMVHDPHSAGYCHIFRFASRITGRVLCPLAARWLRIP